MHGNAANDLSRILGEPDLAVDLMDRQILMDSLGIVLPSDYIQWAEKYESLEICNELIVWNWFSKRMPLLTPESVTSMLKGIDLGRATSAVRRNVYDSQGVDIGPLPWLPLYPEAGGLFPWGTDTNGTLYLWNTSNSDPDEWTVVLYERFWREFDCGFAEFLARLLSGEFLNSKMFIREWPWIPAVRELESEDSGNLVWRTPLRWADYHQAHSDREDDFDYEWDDFSWVDQFRR